MQHKPKLIEISNDEESGVISGFIFLSGTFVCFNCHFSGNDFEYYISFSLVVCHLVIQSFSGLFS